jgi:hypothetical protein
MMRRTPLRVRKPLRRRTALKATTGLARTARPRSTTGEKPRTPLTRRTPVRQVSKKRAREITERRAMLAAKYPGRPQCEVPYCNRWADDAHELLTRARGGSITDPGNVVAICRPHHNEVTFEEPEWAYELGFLKHSWNDGDEAA